MNFNSLPDICTTEDVMAFLGRSRATVTTLLKEYKSLCISNRPYRIAKTNLIDILEKTAVPDVDKRRAERRKRRV